MVPDPEAVAAPLPDVPLPDVPLPLAEALGRGTEAPEDKVGLDADDEPVPLAVAFAMVLLEIGVAPADGETIWIVEAEIVVVWFATKGKESEAEHFNIRQKM